MIIGYFRSINYHNLIKNKSSFLPYTNGEEDFQITLERTRTFGSESEGVEINSLTDAMKTRLTIFCVDQDGLHPIQNFNHLENKNFYLFYRPGHYEIVYPSR